MTKRKQKLVQSVGWNYLLVCLAFAGILGLNFQLVRFMVWSAVLIVAFGAVALIFVDRCEGAVANGK